MKVLKGKKCLGLGFIREDNHKDYMLVFYKEDKPIAYMYYHKDVGEVILETDKHVGLKKDTLESMMLYYNFKMFQLQRKLIQSHFRRERNKR